MLICKNNNSRGQLLHSAVYIFILINNFCLLTELYRVIYKEWSDFIMHCLLKCVEEEFSYCTAVVCAADGGHIEHLKTGNKSWLWAEHSWLVWSFLLLFLIIILHNEIGSFFFNYPVLSCMLLQCCWLNILA